MNDKEYLKSRIKINDAGCWIWQGSTNNVYGTLGRNNIRWLSHRFSYFIHHGEIRDKNVCHRCDTPLCCNPDHLFLGTQKDNLHDAIKKGRNYQLPPLPKGENHPRAKLNKEKVNKIIELVDSGKTKREVAKLFDISDTLVGMVYRKERWA